MKREPILSVRIGPKTEADREKLSRGLERLAATDPTFRTEPDAETGETILWGLTELHLDVIIVCLLKDFGVEARIGAPEVPYRETISKETEHTYTHKKVVRGERQFAEVTMVIAPLGGEDDNAFENRSELLGEFGAGIERGIQSVLSAGPINRSPVTDVRVSLIGGRSDANSSAIAFEIAARMCIREALKKHGALLEPIMMAEVFVAEEHTGAVIGDLVSRRGKFLGTEARGDLTVVRAHVPLANTFGYLPNLRSMTRGAGVFDMWFDHYAPVWTGKGPDDDPPMAMAVRA